MPTPEGVLAACESEGPLPGGLLSLKRRALERAIPLTAHLELTYACNCDCVFCYNARRSDVWPLTSGEWTGALEELRALGTLVVVLTGGEPLARPDFFEIADAARQRAFALKVFTNGALVTDEVARRLAGLRPLAVEVTLHGALASTHDSTTRIEGSHAATLHGIDRLRRLGVPLLLKTPLTSLNEAELEQIIALAERRHLPLRVDPNLTPSDDRDFSPLRYAPSNGGLDRLMRCLAERGELLTAERTAGSANCGLGRLTIAIDPEGNVFPCAQWRQSTLGNVRDLPLRDLWRDSPVRQEVARVASEATSMLLGLRESTGVPYCPALALAHTGDALRPHRQFLDNAAAAHRARLAFAG